MADIIRTNYSKEANSYPEHKEYYNRCANQVIEFCSERNILYHIKDGTMTRSN